jgi:thiamine pyrophosphate-dependent acetolactate synthase large subunit-like protein
VAYPDSRVFMLTGDGAFGFNGMEFDTAVRHKLNIVALLGNDSAWGIDRQIQLGLYGASRHCSTSQSHAPSARGPRLRSGGASWRHKNSAAVAR